MRRLVSIRRTVPERRREAYDATWARLRSAVEARSGHAWRFVARDDPDRFIEFIEFAADDDPRTVPEVADPLAALAADLGGDVEEWEEGG